MNDTYLIDRTTLTLLSDSINMALDREESDRVSYTPIEMQHEIQFTIPAYYNEKIANASATADAFGPINIDGIKYEPIPGTKEFICAGYVDALQPGTPLIDVSTNTAVTNSKGLLYQANIQEKIGEQFTVTGIADKALKEGKQRLQQVFVPGTLDIKLGDTKDGGSTRLFQSCGGITTAVLGEGLKNLGHMMFDACTKLTNLNLPSTLEVIDTGALKKTSLTTLTIPSTISEIRKYALTIPSLQTLHFSHDGGHIIDDSDLSKPILQNMFATTTKNDGTVDATCTNITDIYVPWSEDEVSGYPWGAACNPTMHYEYNIIKYYRSYYDDTLQCAGYGATMPNEFTIPEKYQDKTVRVDAMSANLIAPPNVNKINLCIDGGTGYGGIGTAEGLETIYIGPKVQYFAEYGFGYTPNLQNIILDPDNPYFQVKSNCLMSMNGLIVGACRNSVIPEDATGIDYGVFSCYDIPELWIPETVDYIAPYAFNDNTIIYMPWTESEVRAKEWYDEYNWGAKEVIYQTELPTFTYRLNDDGMSYTLTGYSGYDIVPKLPSEYNGKPVTTIGANAFSWTTDLGHELDIPNSITVIENEAFNGAYFQMVNIPDSVHTIGTNAFKSDQYPNIYINHSAAYVMSIAANAFSGCNVYVNNWQHEFIDANGIAPESLWGARSIYYYNHYLPSPTTFNIGANCLNESTRSEYDWYYGRYTTFEMQRRNDTYIITIYNPDSQCNHIIDIFANQEGQIYDENQYADLYSYNYTNTGNTLTITTTGTIDDNKLLHILDEYAMDGYFEENDVEIGPQSWSGSIAEMSPSYAYITTYIPLGEVQSTWYTDQEWQTETFIESPTWSSLGLVLVHHSTGRTYSIPESYEGTSVYIEQSTVNTSTEQSDARWNDAWTETTSTSALNQWIAGCLEEADEYEPYWSNSPADLKQYFTIYCDE